jgi:hypothetical protein
MTEADIRAIGQSIGLGDPADIVARIEELGKQITMANMTYTDRSEASQGDADYLKQANISLSAERQAKIDTIEKAKEIEQRNALIALGNRLLAEEGRYTAPTEIIPDILAEDVSDISEKYVSEKDTAIVSLAAAYAMSPLPPAPPKMIDRLKSWFGGMRKQQKTTPARATPRTTPPVPTPTEIIPVMTTRDIAQSMGTIESGLQKHASTITSLQTEDGKKKFIDEVFGGDAIAPGASLIDSVQDIEKYKSLITEIDTLTKKMNTTFETITDTTTVSDI